MNSKERMKLAMKGVKPDRVPIMCQIATGHMYKNSGIDPIDFWYTSKGFSQANINISTKYKFDGILLNFPGRNPEIKNQIMGIEKTNDGHIITWLSGGKTFVPPDEDPYPMGKKLCKNAISIDEFDENTLKLFKSKSDIPDYYFDIINCIMRSDISKELSIHGEIGTTFENFLLQFGSYEGGFLALLDDPDRSKEIMKKINSSVIIWALAQCSRGIDALKLSSPLAGSGFISRKMYEEFVLPFEKEVIERVKEYYDIPCYIHTCGKIGDRLDLIVETGVDGIECLDPSPLGDVDLEKAIEKIGDKVFIKGNLDSVNELLGHSPENVKKIAKDRIEIGKKCSKGYILSSACSVSPKVPSENILALYDAVEQYGWY
ncbi:MAG TPA: uroporphyrinogen decarboxylase family protein [Ruminiclostridium sp.]